MLPQVRANMDAVINVSNFFGHKCAFHFTTGSFEGEEDWDLILFDMDMHHECSVRLILVTLFGSFHSVQPLRSTDLV